jgi:hypothetical protein
MFFFLSNFFQAFDNNKELEPQFVILAPVPEGNLILAPAPQHCFLVPVLNM